MFSEVRDLHIVTGDSTGFDPRSLLSTVHAIDLQLLKVEDKPSQFKYTEVYKTILPSFSFGEEKRSILVRIVRTAQINLAKNATIGGLNPFIIFCWCLSPPMPF